MDKWMKAINRMDIMDKAETAIKEDIPFIAVGGEELGPFIGKVVECPNCGDLHEVEYADKVEEDGTHTPSKLLGCVKCPVNGSAYLVAIDGKEFKRNPKREA